MIISELDYFEHHGVKGMKWGVRKDRTSTTEESGDKKGLSTGQKVAIGVGATALAAGIVVGAVYAKKHFGTKLSDVSKASETTKGMAEALAKEPMSIIHLSRGKNKGYVMLGRGGMDDPGVEYIKAGLDKFQDGQMKRYGSRAEKVAARFVDPLGRKDFSGRPIAHDVILPESMSKGVRTIDDVVSVAWPKIKDVYEAFASEEGRR